MVAFGHATAGLTFCGQDIDPLHHTDILVVEGGRFADDLYGAFPVKRLLLGLLTVLCSERERPFFIPSPAIQFPERAEGVKGPKR